VDTEPALNKSDSSVVELETLSSVESFFFYFLGRVILPKKKGYLNYPSSQLD
jgi:hypothetical protein